MTHDFYIIRLYPVDKNRRDTVTISEDLNPSVVENKSEDKKNN